MAGKIASTFRAVLDEHRARFDRVTQKVAPAEVKRLYDRAQSSLMAKLRAAHARGRGDTFTAMQHRALLAQIRHGQMMVAKQLGQKMGSVSLQAQQESIRGLAVDFTRLERGFTGGEVVLPLEEASRFSRAVQAHRPTLLRIHETSFARYGAQVVGDMEDDMALGLATGETTGQVIDRIEKTADVEWWRAERIVRTETAYAFNAAHADGIAEAADDIPDLYQRWSEHVDDASGAPLDDRVGVDSLALHGQVARPGEMFTVPPYSLVPDARGQTKVSASLAGKQIECPPSRPNGREVLSPWRPHWGVPGWRWSNGRRVPVTR